MVQCKIVQFLPYFAFQGIIMLNIFESIIECKLTETSKLVPDMECNFSNSSLYFGSSVLSLGTTSPSFQFPFLTLLLFYFQIFNIY